MIYPRIALAITSTLVVASCSPTGNPHLDMCMKITSNIVAGNVEFGEIKESKNNREMRMVLPYTSDGVSSESVCIFTAQTTGSKDSFSGSYLTSPREMTVDGVKIGNKQLMSASLASGKAVLKDTAEETKKQAAAAADDAKKVANEAKDKATELAGEAKDKAAVIAEEAKAKAGEVATQIKDSEAVARAKDLASETTDKAKSAIVEGAKAIQEKLEN